MSHLQYTSRRVLRRELFSPESVSERERIAVRATHAPSRTMSALPLCVFPRRVFPSHYATHLSSPTTDSVTRHCSLPSFCRFEAHTAWQTERFYCVIPLELMQSAAYLRVVSVTLCVCEDERPGSIAISASGIAKHMRGANSVAAQCVSDQMGESYAAEWGASDNSAGARTRCPFASREHDSNRE